MTVLLESQHELFLLRRRHSAKHIAALRHLFQLLVGLDGRHIDRLIGALDAGVERDIPDGFDAVARNDLERHALFLEVINGLAHVVAQLILDQDQRHRVQILGDRIGVNRQVGGTEHQNAYGFSDLIDLFIDLGIFFFIGKYKLSRAHNIGFSVGKGAARPLGFGGERHKLFACNRLHALHIIADSLGGGVALVACRDDGRQRGHDLVVVGVEVDHLMDIHAVGGEGAGLVETEHIHTRQSFDAVHLIDKYLFAGKADN